MAGTSAPAANIPPPKGGGSRARGIAALTAYLAIAMWLAWYIYGFSGDGIAAVVGRALGTLLIPALIALAVAGRRMLSTALPIAILVSALFLLYGEWDEIVSAHDVRQYQAEIATATPDNYLSIINNSKTRIGKVMSALLGISQKSQQQLATILADIDDTRLGQALAPATLENKGKMRELTQIMENKRLRLPLPQVTR